MRADPTGLTVLSPGATVYLNDRAISGTVRQVSIEEKRKVMYQVGYWYNGDFKLVWVNESEVTVKSPEHTPYIKIGFTGA